jgi:hypothetical protein
MDQAIRNKLRSVVTQCRRLLEESIAQQLQGRYDIYATGKKDEVRAEMDVPLDHLSDEERQARHDILAHFEHVKALGYKPREALEQLIREIAFTHLNRLCAYKMMEVRDVYVGGQRFREAVSKGLKSQGFLFYLADHPEDERRFNAGQQEEAYRHFLNWLGGTLSQEIGVLFSPTDPANRVYPPQRVLDEVLDLLNTEELKGIWSEDETIGWVYQYFTPKELRDQARKESQAPRNSYELAFRNQFFTPRYVVEFLTDNTLGRIWYEMRRGNTRLKDECRYMVRRPTEVFLRWDFGDLDDKPPFWDAVTRGDFGALPENATWDEINPFALLISGYEEAERHGLGDCGEFANARLEAYRDTGEWRGNALELWCCLFFEQRRWRHFGHEPQGEDFGAILALYQALRRALTSMSDGLGQDELLKRPVFIPIRSTKDPREIKILDPACGSGHFLLYCFALLIVIYEEAYDDPDLGPCLQAEYPSKDDLRKAIPSLILRHNLHGIDIDLRCTQIAALALWLRCQRAYQEMGLKKDRPPILKANVVCAEPMPGEEGLLHEFLKTLREDRLEALIRQVMNVPKDQRVRATRGMVESLSDLVRTVWDKMRLAGEAGSLLKVEDDLQDAIRRGQEQWEERLPLFRFTEYGLSEEPKERLVRFVPGDVEGERLTFWDKAETLVRRALDEFISFASNGGRFRRQLFVEDAEQGLGFVDVCRQHYDVALMNPPFGEPSKLSKGYVERAYCQSKNDVYAAFVERGLGLLIQGGMLGAITSRTGFFLTSLQEWREEIILGEAKPTVFADLGYGVLDAALVEVAAYCLERSNREGVATFFRALAFLDKKAGLDAAYSKADTEPSGPLAYTLRPDDLKIVPGSPFAYWVRESMRSLFKRFPRFESKERQARRGASTGDDERRVRCWWEVGQDTIGRDRRWVPFAKGGAYSPYHADVHLLVGWDESRRTFEGFYGRPGRMIERPEALDYFFRAGLTWPRRSTSGFGIRVLPAGCVIADKGPAAFVPAGQEYASLGLLFSQSYQRLIELSLAAGEESQSGTASRSYEVGLIQKLPWPPMSAEDVSFLADHVRELVLGVRSFDTIDELTHSFVAPVACGGPTLRASSIYWQRHYESMCVRLLHNAAAVEDRVSSSLFDGVEQPPASSGDARSLCSLPEVNPPDNFDEVYSRSIHETIREELEEVGGNRQIAVKSFYVSRHIEVLAQTLGIRPERIVDAASNRCLVPEGLLRLTADSLLSYSVGTIFGRWDVRYADGARSAPELPDPFAELPVCSPGMLHGPSGLQLTETPDEYPLRIDWDGILVDDPDHADDILRRVRDVLEVIWEDRADAIEKEACEILGVSDLRDYFRKPGAGGFWDDHIKRYSKSRRKAPIYWLLQSSKKNYALWLYQHRLDKDILFKALLNYVEPKIRKEEARLAELRSQKAAAGPAAKGAKKLDKDIDRQEAFLSELRDFEDRLRRAANLHLDPDLNDGVVLNIAPLHELVPWKEAKSYWDDLMDGNYEWSSIAKQLREKGLVQ